MSCTNSDDVPSIMAYGHSSTSKPFQLRRQVLRRTTATVQRYPLLQLNRLTRVIVFVRLASPETTYPRLLPVTGELALQRLGLILQFNVALLALLQRRSLLEVQALKAVDFLAELYGALRCPW